MDQLCAAAQVSKRTANQHFTGKDELTTEYLRRFDPSVLSGVFDRTDLTPRERLLAVFDIPPATPLCPRPGWTRRRSCGCTRWNATLRSRTAGRVMSIQRNGTYSVVPRIAGRGHPRLRPL
jgi:AcrR family transcriptional regulator